MLQDNGGSVEVEGEDWELHPVLDETDTKRIARTCNDILRETAEAREWDGFPDNALCIGTNGSGDLLVLLRVDEDRYDDTVHIWNHETRAILALASAAELFRKG